MIHNNHYKFADFTPNQKLTFMSSSLGTTMKNMDFLFLSFSMAPIIAQLGISSAAGGLMLTITNVAKLIGGVTFGLLSDAYSRVKIFTYTLALIAIATAAMYFANNIYIIYVCRFITGLGAGGEYGAGVTLLAENFSHHKLGSLISRALSIGQAGIIVAALLSAVILPTYGWHTLFLFGLIPIILAFFVRRNLKENPKFVQNLKIRRAKHQQRPPFSRLFANERISYQTIALVVMVLIMGSNYGFMSWIPDIMKTKLGLSTSDSSLLMIGIIVGLMIGIIIFGKILDAKGIRTAFATFLIGSVFAVYLLKLPLNQLPVSPFISLLFINAVLGFFLGSTCSGFGVIISRLYPMSIRVTANSFIWNLGWAIGGGLAPVMIGFLMDHYSLTAVLISLSVLSIISLLVMLSIPSLKRIKD